jgi:hypothetical protein
MSTYSPHGRSYGNPWIDSLMFGFTGFNYAPRPMGQQSVYDSYIQRQRSRDFMNIQGNAFAGNMLFRHAGMNPNNSMLQFLGRNMASPDSPAARLLSPLIGGNPMATQMQLYAGLQGANMMGNFGRMDSVSLQETNKMMQNLEGTFYKKKPMDQVTREMNASFSNTLLSNPAIAKQYGFGLSLDPAVTAARQKQGASLEGSLTGIASDYAKLKTVSDTTPVNTNISKELVAKLEKKGSKITEEIRSMADQYDSNEAKKGTKEYNEELAKVLNEQLKKKLKSTLKLTEEELRQAVGDNKYSPEQMKSLTQKIQSDMKSKLGMTDAQIKEATNPDGTLKNDVINKVLGEQRLRAGALKEGVDPDKLKGLKLSEVADKIISLSYDRNQKIAELTSANETIAANQGTDTEAGKQRLADARKRQLAQLKTLGVSDEEIAKNTNSKGNIDSEFLQTKISELSKVTYADREAAKYKAAQAAGGLYGGIDFQKTRGFNTEDFSSAFVAASDLRLTGGKGGVDDKNKGFLENSGGALDAARSIFGDNLSGGQLVGKISDLLGSKAGDLSSAQGSTEIESMLRDVKATARVAGVSIDAMIQTIDAAKDLAKNNPRLRYLSAATTTDMTVKAFSTTAAMAGVMSNADYRKQGGTQGMVAKNISEQQALLSGDIGQSLMALQQSFKGDAKKLAAVRSVMESDKFKGNITPDNFGAFLAQVGSAVGEDPNRIATRINDPTMRDWGSQDDEISKYTSAQMKGGGTATFFEAIGRSTGESKEDVMASYKEWLADPENKEKSTRDFISTKYGGRGEITALFGRLENTVEEEFLRTSDPEYFDQIEKRRARSKEIDTELAKQLGSRNAPAVTQIMSTLAEGGEINPEKTEKLFSIFADNRYSPEKQQQLERGFGKAVQGAGMQDAKTVAAGLNDALGLDLSDEDVSNMSIAGKAAGSYEAAMSDYKTLQSKGASSPEEKKRLKAYKDMEKAGILQKKAFDVFLGGEGVASVVGGAVEGERQKKNEELIKATRLKEAGLLNDEFQERLGSANASDAEKQTIQKLMSHYSSSPEGVAKMMQDAKEGTGVFDKDSTAGKAIGVDFDQGEGAKLKRRIMERNNGIDELMAEKGGDGGSDPTKDLGKQIKDLVKAINEGKLVSAISGLAGAVRGT